MCLLSPGLSTEFNVEHFLVQYTGKKRKDILTMSELKGFTLMLRVELLVRDQTLVLCLKAALTFGKKIKIKEDRKKISLKMLCAFSRVQPTITSPLAFLKINVPKNNTVY